jgi:hypothetical protein
VVQLVARRLAVRQARVPFSARHHREVFPTELTCDEEMERGCFKFPLNCPYIQPPAKLDQIIYVSILSIHCLLPGVNLSRTGNKPVPLPETSGLITWLPV